MWYIPINVSNIQKNHNIKYIVYYRGRTNGTELVYYGEETIYKKKGVGHERKRKATYSHSLNIPWNVVEVSEKKNS